MTQFASFKDRRVFVTGHTGFKGSWLCEWLLALGAQVHGYSLEPNTSPSLFNQLGLAQRLEHEINDIRDADSLRKAVASSRPDFVFHLAAQPIVRLSYRAPIETWQTNVIGTLNLMEALRNLQNPCAAVFATTDKVYENREWNFAYREEDPLGGHDPYSSSKAAAEIGVNAWRRSFLTDNHPVRLATARAGNVIGGGDWAEDRILPDAMRALAIRQPIPVRNPASTRPWQHVLEPLSGYLSLAARMAESPLEPGAFNFGPSLGSNRAVRDLIAEVLTHWPGEWQDRSSATAVHEAAKLNLATDKAFHLLGWQPRWDFSTTIQKTVNWYQEATKDAARANVQRLTQSQITDYLTDLGA